MSLAFHRQAFQSPNTFPHPSAIFWVGQLAENPDDLGVDLDATDEDGCTALMYAVTSKHVMLTTRLMHKVNVNAQDKTGKTALHYAVLAGNRAIAHALIRGGAGTELCDKDGATPLMYAALFGYEDVVALLIARGANRHHADKNGRTALHYAACTGYRRIADALTK